MEEEELIDETLDEIEILYVPDTLNSVNIFDKNTLTNLYNQYFNNIYRSQEVVCEHFDILNNRWISDNNLNDNDILYLKDTEYSEPKPPLSVKPRMNAIYKNAYPQYIRLIENYMNPLEFKAKDTEEQYDINEKGVYINLYNREFYIHNTEIPVQCVDKHETRYKISHNEDLVSMLLDFPEERDRELKFENDTFQHVNNMMKRYGKDIYHMTEEETNKIPLIDDKQSKQIEIDNPPEKEFLLYQDGFVKALAIGKYKNDMTSEEIEDLINKLGDVRTDISDTKLMYYDQTTKEYNYEQLISDVANGIIDPEVVIDNANKYLSLLRTEHSIKTLLDIKNHDEEKIDINDTIKIENIKDVFDTECVFDKDFAEVIAGESDNPDNNMYFVDTEYEENVDISNQFNSEDVSKSIFNKDEEYQFSFPYKDNKTKYDNINKLLKDIIFKVSEYSGLRPSISSILERSVYAYENFDCFTAVFFINWYFDIYTGAITNELDQVNLILNKNCNTLWNMSESPIQIEAQEKKLIDYGNSSIFKYMICCMEEFYENKNKLYKHIVEQCINNPGLNEKLRYIHDLYKSKKTKVESYDFYVNMMKQLRKTLSDDPNSVDTHSRYIKTLLYLPSYLKRINNFAMGCCKQKLGDKFRAFGDINNNDSVLKYLNRYMAENQKSNMARWDVIEYPVYIDYDTDIKEEFVNKELTIVEDDPCDVEYDILEIIKDIEDFPHQQFKKNRELKEFVNTNITKFGSYVDKKSKEFDTFIYEKCKDIMFIKKLLSFASNISESIRDKVIYYKRFVDDLENTCCTNSEFVIQRKFVYRAIASMFIVSDGFEDNEFATELHNSVLSIKHKVISRDEYNAMIAHFREEIKINKINKLENKSRDEKELLKFLQEKKIYSYMDEATVNPEIDNTNDEFENFKYNGDDDNFVEL